MTAQPKPLCELTHLEALARVQELEARAATVNPVLKRLCELLEIHVCHADAKDLSFLPRELILEREENDALREKMAALLKNTANALKGPPGPLKLHDWSDLPAVAARTIQRLESIKTASSAFSAWWGFTEAQEMLCDQTIPDDAVVFHFSGSGASTSVTAGQVRSMLTAIYPEVPK